MPQELTFVSRYAASCFAAAGPSVVAGSTGSGLSGPTATGSVQPAPPMAVRASTAAGPLSANAGPYWGSMFITCV